MSVLPLSIQSLYFSLQVPSKHLTVGKAFQIGPLSLMTLLGTAFLAAL